MSAVNLISTAASNAFSAALPALPWITIAAAVTCVAIAVFVAVAYHLSRSPEEEPSLDDKVTPPSNGTEGDDKSIEEEKVEENDEKRQQSVVNQVGNDDLLVSLYARMHISSKYGLARI